MAIGALVVGPMNLGGGLAVASPVDKPAKILRAQEVRMRLRKLGMIALLGAAAAIGCSKKDDDKGKKKDPKAAQKTDGDKKGDDTAAKAVDLAKKNIKGVDTAVDTATNVKNALSKKEGTFTMEQYEKMMLQLSQCKLVEWHHDYACEQYKEFQKARGKLKAPKGVSELGKKHLRHPHPGVRLYAAGMMKSFFGASKDNQKLVLDTISAEKHPAVVKALVNVVGSKASVNPDVATMLFAMTKHEAPMVRMEALGWLATSFADKVKGSVKRLIEMAQKDEDPKVRQYACKKVGDRGKLKALAMLKKQTGDKAAAKDPALYAACLEGMKSLWFHYPFFRHAHEQAFDLYFTRLSTPKCGKDIPPWGAFSWLGEYMNKPGFAKVATWYNDKKKKQAIKALARAAMCKKSGWMVHTRAIESMKHLGAPKSEFVKLRKAYEKDKKDHFHTVSALDKLIK